jgi:type VI secretion system ImpM family protein
MLGKLIGRNRWSWSAFGKHPAARDYFQINLTSSLAVALSKWVEIGFQKVSEDQRRTRACSWRFWARGLKKGHLLCGLGRSSSDSIGRPYPMVVMGEGGMPRWQDHWHLLPLGFGTLWERMEQLATRRMVNLSQLEKAIADLAAPSENWRQIQRRNREIVAPDDADPAHEAILTSVGEYVRVLGTEGCLMIALNENLRGDPLQLAGAWHQAIRNQSVGRPNMVFMGGTTEKVFLALFYRPLTSEDFHRLWTV